MKKLFLIAGAIALTAAAEAAESPLWMRYPAISPDGKTIAFCYQGDIFTVPSTGGRATQLTTNPAYDTRPVWSPDGKSLAFASDREGSFDIYIMSREGGAPTRLTTHSASEMPETFLDNEHVLYTASIQPDVNDSQFPSVQFPQIYSVSTTGGRPKLYSSLAMENLSISPDGKQLLYNDMKGYEDTWRKHHTSSITRDIWLCTTDGNRSYRKLTDFNGEDRNPVWKADGSAYYYLSERDGNFNVYKSTIDGKNTVKITSHPKHPVRFLTTSNDGKLCYGYDGEIYTVTEGSQPAKVSVAITSDITEQKLVNRLISSGATDIAVSPSGKEVAFIVHGDVYVTSVEYRTTKQITDTPQQERNIDFSPDGRSLVYSAERGETWGIYESSIVRDDDKYFTYAQEIEEKPLVTGDKTSFQPLYSPDGKEVAFLEDRSAIRVINRKSKDVRTVMEGKYNYSYSDGDQSLAWSPDGRWFLTEYIGVGGWNNKDIALIKADGSGETVNLTESGYSDTNPKWVLDGKAMIWNSDRAGYRSHGSWGSHSDVYIMFFDDEAWDKFQLSKEEIALAEEAEKDKKDKESSANDDKKDKKDKKGKGKKDKVEKEDEIKPIKLELDNRRDRIMRLTVNSSNLGDALLSKKGDKLYYCTSFEGGYDLWLHDLKENSTKLLIKGVGYGPLLTDKDGEKAFLISRGGLTQINIKDANTKSIPFAAEFNYRPAEERDYIFNHAWRQVNDKFYDPEIHGIDWASFREDYSKYLPYINNNYDFRDMLSEMLGELNGSHTGARYYSSTSAPATASLGAFYDESYDGDGLKITQIIAQGPLTKADNKITKGCIIEKINGKTIERGKDYYPMLAGKAGKSVMLTVLDPSTGKRFEEKVKPISYGTQSDFLYKRWVENNRKRVEQLSGGKVGYVHVKGMDSPSFRTVFSDLLGRYRNCDAVIVDTRHNGGGWLHDDLATLLDGKEYARYTPRNSYIGSDPFTKWLKPSCVLVCEDNYSNAHGFPWVYKTLGIGKLIGTPVPGTMTAVWWETQIDPSLVFGIPQVGCKDMDGNYLENHELQPDIKVYNTPEVQLQGGDTQLETAVKEMLNTI